jgi:hypothetical protein
MTTASIELVLTCNDGNCSATQDQYLFAICFPACDVKVYGFCARPFVFFLLLVASFVVSPSQSFSVAPFPLGPCAAPLQHGELAFWVSPGPNDCARENVR